MKLLNQQRIRYGIFLCLLGILVFPTGPMAAEKAAATTEEPDAAPLEELRMFADIFGRIKKD